MSTAPKSVLISGATGFLGRALCQYFDAKGYQVSALVRDFNKAESLREYAKGGIYRCALPDDIDVTAFEGELEALIHCAYANQAKDRVEAEAINIRGSEELLRLARAHDIQRFVFISSLSAHEKAESFYGQSKLSIERLLDPQRDLIIQPGLIMGQGGLFKRMQNSLKRLPVVPLFYGGRQAFQTICVAELCEAIEHGISKDLVGVYKVALNDPIPIRVFYENLAATVGKKCHFVRLPGQMSLRLLRCCETMGLNLPVTSENLLGLKQMQVVETTNDLAQLGIKPMPFAQAVRE